MKKINHQPINLTINGKTMEARQIKNGCLFIDFGGFTYYFDNTTGEIITDKWKTKRKF